MSEKSRSLPEKVRVLWNTYPHSFWTIVVSDFIDHLGGSLIYPFLGLYITQRFGVGMTEVGQMLFILSATSLVGGMLGGALTDKFGRKKMILFSLVVSATSTLFIGLVERLELIYALMAVIGLLADTGGPAYQAVIADILPEDKRAEGYGILRVDMNLAVTIGPAIGGLLAMQSYTLLFVLDAVCSLVTAGVVLAQLPETKPEAKENEENQSLRQTFIGYVKVMRDRLFLAFVAASILMAAVYAQMNSSLSVYLNDIHKIPAQGFGFILSLNAIMVVVFQFWITRQIKHMAPMILISTGTLLYAVGFAMYGFVSTMPMFLLAMVVITVGEMISVPPSQTLVARFAPEQMRGRYMAFYGISWVLPWMFAPLGAGLIMDNMDPRWVWYLCGVIGAIAALLYALMHPAVEKLPQEEDGLEDVQVALGD